MTYPVQIGHSAVMINAPGTSLSVTYLSKGDVVERTYLDPANWEYVIEVRRADGTITEERVGLLASIVEHDH